MANRVQHVPHCCRNCGGILDYVPEAGLFQCTECGLRYETQIGWQIGKPRPDQALVGEAHQQEQEQAALKALCALLEAENADLKRTLELQHKLIQAMRAEREAFLELDQQHVDDTEKQSNNENAR